jgi:alkylation response protein AidB-like acyl-CoA dehydrogenase
MKKLHIVFASLALAFTFTATTAHADTYVSKADAQQFLAFFDKFADTAVADKASCPKMAADMSSEIDANKAMLDKARAAAASGKKLPKDAQDHLMQAAQRMMPAFQACGTDAKVKAAMQRLNFGSHGH